MIALTPQAPDQLETPGVPAQPDQIIAPVVALTDAACKQIRRTLARKQQSLPGAFLRLGVKGGGCSGLSYIMGPDTEFDEGDRTWVTEDGIRVVIDTKSMAYLTGTVIDYDMKNLLEGGWVYKNPNAARSCGCGTSFTPAG
jgi:iron-sulfur cluster assembly protein